MQLPSERELKQYDRWGVERPSHTEHGDFNPDNLIPFEATRWWVSGNELHADGNHGHFMQRIPTDYICTGTDENNLPIFKKIVIN